MSQNKDLIAIDPGKSGGIAWYTDNLALTCKMPDTPVDLWEQLESLVLSMDYPTVYIEKVGYHVQGNSASSSVKFGRHVGMLEGMLVALQVDIVWVAPTVWMRGLGVMPREKKTRKNYIKSLMQERFRHLKVTLSTADALGILIFGMRSHKIAGY